MAYTYQGVSTATSISKQGVTIKTQTGASTDLIKSSIGDRIQFKFGIDASGTDDFLNKKIVVNQQLFLNGLPLLNINGNVGWNTLTSNTLGVYPMTFSAGAFTNTNTNLTAELNLIDAVTAEVTVTFMVCSDLRQFLPASIDNATALLAMEGGGANYMYDVDNTAYSTNFTDSKIAFSFKLIDGNFNTKYATNLTGGRFYTRLVALRWYGRNYGSTDWEFRTNQLRVSTRYITAQKDFSSTSYQKNYDKNFEYAGNEISPFEKNEINFTIDTSNNPTASIPDVVKVFLIEESNIQNNVNFIADYQLKSSIIPLGTTGVGTIFDGAIESPSGVFFITNAIIVRFNIDGQKLTYGRRYRVGVVMYDTTTGETFSTISHTLNATALPECLPDEKSFIGDYYGETETDAATVTIHERISSRMEIDKVSMNTCFALDGVPFNFDTDIRRVRMYLGTQKVDESTPESGVYELWNEWVNIGGLENTFSKTKNFGLLENSTTLNVYSSFRVEQKSVTFGNLVLPIKWEYTFSLNVQNFSVLFTITKYHLLKVNNFIDGSSDGTIEFYDAATYPANKTKIFNLCDQEKIVVEMLLQNGYEVHDPVENIPIIYKEIGSNGETSNQLIKEENPNPQTSLLSPIDSPEITNADPSSVSNIASFCIDLTKLNKDDSHIVESIIKI